MGDCVAWKPLMAPQAIVINRKGKNERALGMKVGQIDFGDIVSAGKEHDTNTNSHNQQNNPEYGVEFGNDPYR